MQMKWAELDSATAAIATAKVPKVKSTPNTAVAALGRLLFAGIFIASGPLHFSQETIQMATAHEVPLAYIAVPASGLLAMAGGLSILLGYKAKLGAWMLVLFLVPVTLMLHPFWAATDAEAMKLQLTMFMKNLSLIGGALLITQFGAGPMSLDSRRAD